MTLEVREGTAKSSPKDSGKLLSTQGTLAAASASVPVSI